MIKSVNQIGEIKADDFKDIVNKIQSSDVENDILTKDMDKFLNPLNEGIRKINELDGRITDIQKNSINDVFGIVNIDIAIIIISIIVLLVVFISIYNWNKIYSVEDGIKRNRNKCISREDYKNGNNELKKCLTEYRSYIKNLEEEVKTLKVKIRDLEKIPKTNLKAPTINLNKASDVNRVQNLNKEESLYEKMDKIVNKYNELIQKNDIGPLNARDVLFETGKWQTLYCQNADEVLKGAFTRLSTERTRSSHFEICDLANGEYAMVPSLRYKSEPWSGYEIENSLALMYDLPRSVKIDTNAGYLVTSIREISICRRKGNQWEVVEGKRGRIELVQV